MLARARSWRMRPATLGRTLSLAALPVLLAGCALLEPSTPLANARLTPPTRVTRDLVSLPEPKGKVVVAVYGMRDQTGQYRPAPDSTFSTTVTQGAAALLVKALHESQWFIPVEREGLQDLLTERRIVRALETPTDRERPGVNLPALRPATIMIQGAIIAYESNVHTGGAGARLMGVGTSTRYQIDQVTVNLRSVDIRTGTVVNNVSTTKTIYSMEVGANLFKFVNFKRLLEMETGFTRNEPAQMAVKEAIEAAVVHLIVQGVRDGTWALANGKDIDHPLVQAYLREDSGLHAAASDGRGGAAPVDGNTGASTGKTNIESTMETAQ